LKTAQANSLQDPISKNPITKNWAAGVAQGEGPEFKPQYRKKEEWIKKIYLYTMEFYSATRKNEILSFTSKWNWRTSS
jgi:hypothetical protein